jgi:hypothetical protein
MNLIEQAPVPKVAPRKTDDVVEGSRAALVKQWLRRIASAEKKWQPKFDEMRKNMEFVGGWQWDGQQQLDDDRYISNLTLRVVNQKVASLYARNPITTVERRKRMDYLLWDGELMSLMNAISNAQQAAMTGMPPSLEDMALIQDYQMGRLRERFTDRVCRSLETAYQYQLDMHRPEFKEQMKQLVRRVIICKVGYVKLRICRTEEETTLSTVTAPSKQKDRIQRAQEILLDLQEGELDAEAPEVEEAKNLLLSVGASNLTDEQAPGEYLEFDFPSSTSIIPSEECRSLKEFIAAKFVAQKYRVAPELVEAIFGVEIGNPQTDDGANALEYKTVTQLPEEKSKESDGGSYIDLYEVFDIQTKTRFFVAKGYKDYILEPEPLTPQIAGFWPIFGLTFNDIEAEDNTRSSIFPPSDVDLIRNPQKEWNRTRDALRSQRNANAPKYVCADGTISEDDEIALANAKPNHVTKLKSLPPGVEPDKFIKILQTAAIDPMVYDTAPLEKDILMSGGMQESNIGQAGKDVTATVGSIAEQSRMTMLASNVDDLDGFLTRIGKAGVELILRGMSQETMAKIAGVGALLPTDDINDFVNGIQIKVQAASSGRPNRAMGIANAQQIAPILLQAGANPVAIVEEMTLSMWINSFRWFLRQLVNRRRLCRQMVRLSLLGTNGHFPLSKNNNRGYSQCLLLHRLIWIRK